MWSKAPEGKLLWKRRTQTRKLECTAETQFTSQRGHSENVAFWSEEALTLVTMEQCMSNLVVKKYPVKWRGGVARGRDRDRDRHVIKRSQNILKFKQHYLRSLRKGRKRKELSRTLHTRATPLLTHFTVWKLEGRVEPKVS